MIIRDFYLEGVCPSVNNVHRYTAWTFSDTCYIRQTRVRKQPATPDGADRPDGAEPAQLCGPQCAVRGATAGAGRIPSEQRADRVSDQRVSRFLHDRGAVCGAAGRPL